MALIILFVVGLVGNALAANTRIPPANCSNVNSILLCGQGDYTASYGYNGPWRPDDIYTGVQAAADNVETCSCYCMSTGVYAAPSVAPQLLCERPSYLYGVVTGWMSVNNVILTISILGLIFTFFNFLLACYKFRTIRTAVNAGGRAVTGFITRPKKLSLLR